MFRRQPTIVFVPGRTETQYVTREVHEHRAPTDESVALLKEFEDAADKRRISSIQLTNNDFHGKVFVESLPYAAETLARCVFDINGKRLTVDAKEDMHHAEREPHKLLLSLRDNIAQRIAGEILTELASGALTEWLGRATGPVQTTTAKPKQLEPISEGKK